ncbi:MSHA biogenesis protein MshA [Colwellia sp. BRX8-8]|nr:MSHA biogenesis protein MshA [Colwellia sp. BRX8-8]
MELVIVIVILGILAATAAPKFINLTGDARSATVEAVEGALNSAADLARAKALVSGTANGSLSIAGSTIVFAGGWPTEETIGLLLEIDSTGSDFSEVSGTPGTFTHNDAAEPTTCQAIYNATGASNTVRPDIKSIVTDCN